jgi:hypothetical protein
VEHGESFGRLPGHHLKRIPGAVSPDEEQAIIVTDDPDSADNGMTNVGIGDAVLPC